MSKNVSIVTASYNYENYIKETIESVLNQTIPDWEMIIVDDGSEDNSVDVIKSYCEKDNRIKLFQHENNANKGLSETVQLGIQKAKNDWIIFLESDDTIEPNYIEEKLKVIEKYSDIKFIFNDVNMFGNKKMIKKREKNYFSYVRKLLSSISYPANISENFRKINIIPTFSCVMLHKDTLLDIDWDSPIKKLLDYYVWTQIASKYEFYYLDKKLSNWRISNNSYVNKYQAPKKQELLFSLDILKHITKGNYKYDDFIFFVNEYVECWQKYKHYKKLFKILLIIVCTEILLLLVLIKLLF